MANFLLQSSYLPLEHTNKTIKMFELLGGPNYMQNLTLRHQKLASWDRHFNCMHAQLIFPPRLENGKCESSWRCNSSLMVDSGIPAIFLPQLSQLYINGNIIYYFTE